MMIFPDTHPFFINLGIILLFFPPIILWRTEWIIKKYEAYLYQQIIIPFTVLGTALMIILVPEAYMAFTIYFGLFWVSMLFIETKLGQTRTDAFLLSVYLCFCVAVLWEWPIQLAIQLPYEEMFFQAQIMSLFEAVAIPLFILKCRQLGWKPNSKQIRALIVIILCGIDLTILLSLEGVTPTLYWASHLYRLPWILLLLSFIPKNLYSKQKISNNILRS